MIILVTKTTSTHDDRSRRGEGTVRKARYWGICAEEVGGDVC
jgi:hypothetical protein